MKVFLDANILMSASMQKSQMRLLVFALKKHGYLLTNSYAIEEARRNVQSKKPEALVLLEALCAECELIVATVNSPVALAEKDIPILGGAIACGATYLMTGDKKDFGMLWGKTVQGITVISPQMLAEKLIKRDLFSKTKQ
ncbi:MAG: DNA-binding protein [Candidatus Taylorbacteria bacterium CG11_big_fil_rev_8_21_14_0_20_46_11]|uniref:DNA-binding protein n=1 Tax=Candidatus Taylorbacteria bacterium CG11_big_fil_rev_8_21_14_0_20_46_11 TaxID=1975025 RepID=A0A2H0KA45_9BACT|nr:MAG: DNA-binding protein [Candidatus Taylorbacteria bacterium CG11_big_fil_rev_8_21_14_0_20_46_11]